MPYLTNLAAVARRTGFPVVEQWGWRSRGHGPMGEVRSVICHHDAARQPPDTFNTVVQNGHGSLPGPLAQFALRRDGTIHVVAAGLSYHAGANVNPSLYGNSHAIGIEAGNDGVGEPWPARQLQAYYALCAELCKEFGLPVSRVRGHKEIAPQRKIDPHGINMDVFRGEVARSSERDELDDMDRHTFEFYVKNGVFKALMDDDIRQWIRKSVWYDTTVYRDEQEIPALQELADAKTRAEAAEARVSALSAAVSALSESRGITREDLERVVFDAVSQHMKITGTVEISGKESA